MPEPAHNELLETASRAVDAGQYNDALGLLRTIAEAQPGDARVFEMAGRCLLRLGDYTAALDAFQRAVRIEAGWPAPYRGAAEALAGRGDAHASMQALLHVLTFAPGDLAATQQLAGLLMRLNPDAYLPSLEPALSQCFSHPDIDPGLLGGLCAQQLRLSLADRMGAGQGIDEDLVAAVADSELWIQYLSKVVNTDPELEDFLARLRRNLCLRVDAEPLRNEELPLLSALAQQCFLNEYVFGLDSAESEKLGELRQFIRRAPGASEAVALAFAIRCLYEAPPLDPETRTLAEALCADYPWLASLCALTVFERFEEAKIAESIPTLHPVRADVSLAVQAQYEANPYPRWRTPPAPPSRPRLLQALRRQFSQGQESPALSDRPRLLVAGCGTGYEPIDIARRDDSIAITAIDLSRSSLAYARRKALQLGCANIVFYEGDILDLPRTSWRFDFIISTGVLHHMADPIAGWEVLRDCLAPNGMMRISLYSAHARRSIRAARSLIRDVKVSGAKDEDIRGFRQHLLQGNGARELDVLLSSDDFYSMSGCRDLVFHVQEHQFDLPQIESAIARLKLRFCGFDLADSAVKQAFQSCYPDPGAMLDLEKWDEFENRHPDIFAGMYQFWCEPG